MCTYSQPLGVVGLARSKQRIKRVVTGNDEAGDVGQELTAEIEENQEEVQRDGANHGIRLGDSRLLLKVGESRVLGELPTHFN